MWGYIAREIIFHTSQAVPSLYVRVYRKTSWRAWAKARSLTVCEGISLEFISGCRPRQFPHCMWGYIDRIRIVCRMAAVPSLYVRVYLNDDRLEPLIYRSLTVCEGVSFVFLICYRDNWFPHCMWGCISTKLHSVVIKTRSLTVCEGVSIAEAEEQAEKPFPHCMWGCIAGALLKLVFSYVPSLYVRVYRTQSSGNWPHESSLTVCEGVSKPHWHVLIMFAFPHYTWGCIDTSRKEWNV